MIAIGDPSSGWQSALYAVAFIASFIIALVTCVCNPKSKRFHKHKSFILSHDLPNEVPLNVDLTQAQTALPAQTSTEIDPTNNKLKSIPVHRALPDIPQVAAGSSSVPDGSAPFSNCTSFGDVVDVDSLYTVANNNTVSNLHNHPYARIRNNLLVDSSTENDTDDYSESRLPAVSTVQCHIEGQFRTPIHEPNDTYELEPQPHILRLQLRNNIEPPLFNNEPEEKKEISYNTISVREPLSKVLAERENIEHHYNEVEEEERISSYYEEITSGSSATYSKINEVNSNKPGYGDSIPSTSHHRHIEHDAQNIGSSSNGQQDVNGPLYSFVDKRMKRSNLQAAITNAPTDANNLYTMVVKSPSTGVKVVDSKAILQRYSPPPPLPPVHRDTQPKLYRNTIMFGTPSNSGNNNHHQNYHHNYNTLLEEFDQEQNIYHKIDRQDSEKDPGYEIVDRNETDKMVNCNQNDYGYEAIAMDENDPAYEIVKADTSDDNNPAYETIKNETYSQDEQSDPNYEIIPSTNARVTVHYLTGVHSVQQHDTNVNANNDDDDESCIIDENTIIEHL